jgi:hypothetical protein
LKQIRKISESDYGHDEQEWGHKDDSEKLEWEEYYTNRSRKWTNQYELYEEITPEKEA